MQSWTNRFKVIDSRDPAFVPVLAIAFLALFAAPSISAAPAISLARTSFGSAESISIQITGANNPTHAKDWIGVYEAGVTPSGNPGAIWWVYLGDQGVTLGQGTIVFDAGKLANERYAPGGRYQVVLAYDDSYTVEASAQFSVTAVAQDLAAVFSGKQICTLLSVQTGLGLRLQGGAWADSSPVIQKTFEGGRSEQWQILPSPQADWYWILSRGSFKALSIDGPGMAILKFQDSSDASLWKLVPGSGGGYRLLSKLGGKALGSAGDSLANGVQLALGSAQEWIIRPLPLDDDDRIQRYFDDAYKYYAADRDDLMLASLEKTQETLLRLYQDDKKAGGKHRDLSMAALYKLEYQYYSTNHLAEADQLWLLLSNEKPTDEMMTIAAKNANWLGLRDLGNGDCDKALANFARADQIRKMVPSLASIDDWESMGWYIDLARKRKALGSIKPGYVQKILAIYYKGTDTWEDDGKGGKRHVVSSVEPIALGTSAIIQGLLKTTLEVVTGGKLSLEFRRVKTDVTINATYRVNDTYEEPDLSRVTGDLASVFYANINWADVVVNYWEKSGLNDSGTGFGGDTDGYPLFPYQRWLPSRGFVELPTAYAGQFTFLFHEYFHTVDTNFGYVMHGFTDANRVKFPGWKGSGQTDYYLWHFSTDIPATIAERGKKGDPQPWAKFSWANYGSLILPKPAFDYSLAQVSKVSLADREKARALWSSCDKAMKDGQEDEAYRLLDQMIAINPAYYDAFWYQAALDLKRGDYKAAVGKLQRYLPYADDPAEALRIAGLLRFKLRDDKGADAYYDLAAKYFQEMAEVYAGIPRFGDAIHSYGSGVRSLLDAGKTALALQLAKKGADFARKYKLADDDGILGLAFLQGELMVRTGAAKDGKAQMKAALDRGLSGNPDYVARFRNGAPTLSLGAASFTLDRPITITIANGNNPTRAKDWIGLYEADVSPNGNPAAIWWVYLGDKGVTEGQGTITFDPATVKDIGKRYMKGGTYKFVLAWDDSYVIQDNAFFTLK
jgi:tetratricopeptide (TPR) repeat protein